MEGGSGANEGGGPNEAVLSESYRRKRERQERRLTGPVPHHPKIQKTEVSKSMALGLLHGTKAHGVAVELLLSSRSFLMHHVVKHTVRVRSPSLSPFIPRDGRCSVEADICLDGLALWHLNPAALK